MYEGVENTRNITIENYPSRWCKSRENASIVAPDTKVNMGMIVWV
jgi:hypothetical protein